MILRKVLCARDLLYRLHAKDVLAFFRKSVPLASTGCSSPLPGVAECAIPHSLAHFDQATKKLYFI